MTLLRTHPAFRLDHLSDPWLTFVFTHRLDLQHRRRAGRHRPDSIRRIDPIQLGAAGAVQRQRRASWHVQDRWQPLIPERVQGRPRSPRVPAHCCAAGVHADS